MHSFEKAFLIALPQLKSMSKVCALTLYSIWYVVLITHFYTSKNNLTLLRLGGGQNDPRLYIYG